MILSNFPMVNQLSEPTADGLADENARMNCVAASLAAGLEYLTGKPFDGDQLKDLIYGQGYVGPMAATSFASYCARQGVLLAPHDGPQDDLIATLHREVAAGHPCLVTMPSQWAFAPPDPLHPDGYTHVGIACGEWLGGIRVMNPWGGFWQDEPDDWWAARLCFGEIWILSKEPTMQQLPDGCAFQSDGSVVYTPKDGSSAIRVQGAILHLWLRDPFLIGLPRTAEVPTSASGTTTQQEFYSMILGAQKLADGSWSGMVGDTPNQLALARAQIATLQSQIHQVTPDAVLAALGAALAPLLAKGTTQP